MNDATNSKTYVVTLYNAHGSQSFHVAGLSADDINQMLSRSTSGNAIQTQYRVVELDAPKLDGKAVTNLAGATLWLVVVFFLAALAERRLRKWLKE